MELQVLNSLHITGRGQVFTLSLKANNLSLSSLYSGLEVTIDGEVYTIHQVEAFRKNGKVADGVGIVVVNK